MSLPAIENLRRARVFLKSTAVLVTVAFLGLTLQPLAMAANLPTAPKAQTPAPTSNDEKLAKTLEKVEDRLEKLEAKLTKKETTSSEQNELKVLRQDLDGLDQKAIEDFDKIEKHLKDKKLPQIILDRHAEAVKQYKTEMATLKANLRDLDEEPREENKLSKAKKAKEHLKTKQKKKTAKTKFDPNDLPNQSLKPNTKNIPKLKKEQFIRAGLHSNPYEKFASHGTYNFNQLAGASDPAYLAATTEVVLTDAIRAKAAELEHNPVKIYNWVRNNVEWLPTWGATQDADVTLGSQRGNAFDIASLTIALFRASGIPARYVHGSIEVAEDKFRNWAGGFTDVTAAANYASGGGIPITAIVNGGRITKVQLEHIWVEAAIDFHPSRGAVNKFADSWVQLDPSYKQYQDFSGIDVKVITGIDPVALTQSFANTGTSNKQEGWVSGLNFDTLQNTKTQAKTTLQQHISNLTNPTVGSVIGGRQIIAQNISVLPSLLPYRTFLVGARYGVIPGALQNTISFAFGRDIFGDLIDAVSFPWAKTNNNKITLSFRPATSVDEQTLASFVPPASNTNPALLPSRIPSYLISVIPEIAVNGQVVATGVAMRLGEDLDLVFEVRLINNGPIIKDYKVPAGAYLSLAAIRGSVSPQVLENLETKLTQTRTIVESNNPAMLSGLSREDILGDMFHSGTLAYFSQYIALSRITGLTQGVNNNLAAGFGSLGYEPNVDYFFGFPRAITAGGVAVNVWLADVNEINNGDTTQRRHFQLQTGILSSVLEYAVPEQMFSTPTQRVEGISAVKALQIAASQGQRLYHITSANQAQALPNLHLDGLAMTEITQALATGKEVFAHTDRISVPGWTGEGYILFDPDTGAGAYKITGGANGGGVFWLTVAFLIGAFLLALATQQYLAAVLILGAYYNFLHAVKHIAAKNYTPEKMYSELKGAAALAIMEVVAGFALRGLGHAADDVRIELLEYMMTGWVWIFDWTWFG
ncbi:MAG: hypothetical protein HY081_06980 [Gammaproteobacteria bacterium]|nr:hypothetical protein [Gammaproteobacteria bacterium]